MKRITEGAFAKLNLTLDVLDRRADGYHDIKSIMQTVSLHDDVLVDLGGEGWQVHCYRELLPPDADENTTPELVTCGLPQDRDNLAWKAAEAFYARTGLPKEPNSEVIEVIGKLVVITSLTILHESTRTIINQRSTRLRGMRLKAGIQSPMYPPNDSTHTRF